MRKNTMIKLAAGVAALLLVTTSVNADEKKAKIELKNNMMEVYNTLPSSVDNISDAFTEGVFYGRLRMNSFMWDWKEEVNTKTKDANQVGVGGSLLYKTAPLLGLSATAGMYYTQNLIEVKDSDLTFGKAGREVESRYDAYNSGSHYMTVLAQAYIQYDFSKTSLKAGRQVFESFLTKSNDTKMIPNTFEGFSVESKDIPDTKISAAHIYSQKLRDHSTFHDVITYNDTNTSIHSDWTGNDDSAAHKGLSVNNFKAEGKSVNHTLEVVQVSNKSIKDLQIDVAYTAVPEVVSSAMGEVNYKIGLGGGYSLTPGIRYMKQFDNGGGAVGGASLSGAFASTKNVVGNTSKGYKDIHSLDSSLYMGRLTLKNGPLKVQVAYSAVEDAADIVAPWRGFPTGGYTRAMAQYNWWANTKTTAAEVFYDFGKAGVLTGFSALARFAMQDFDESKQYISSGYAGGVQADSNILQLDFRQVIAKGFEAKVRVGITRADERLDGKNYDSYNEYRFELNYLF